MSDVSAPRPATAPRPGPLTVVELAQGVRMAVHRRGPLPPRAALDGYDLLLTSRPGAPRPWVSIAGADLDARIAELLASAARHPVAFSVLVQVLRNSLRQSFDDAIHQESMAYSLLLGGAEFKAWRAATPIRADTASTAPRVRLESRGETLHVTLCRPEARNAVDARMRDDLLEALGFAWLHPDKPDVLLDADGPAFSAGGDLNEFGQATDLAAAHLFRTERSVARLLRRMTGRVSARLHGACIGAGIEIPAAIRRITVRADSWFRLPELAMGLIPGAGGTVTLPRRIGWRRTLYLALWGGDLDAVTAQAWGLVDTVEGG